MITISIDHAEDLTDLLDSHVQMRVVKDRLQDENYRLMDEKDRCLLELGALKNEALNLKADLVYFKSLDSQKSCNPQNLRALIIDVLSGNKIQAIKVIRELSGLGLKEAKDLLEEAYTTRRNWAYDNRGGSTLTETKINPIP